MTTEHNVKVLPEWRQSDTWYRAVCDCGTYRSGLHGYAGKAESAGLAHAKAKAAGR